MPVPRHQLHGFGVSLDGQTARFEIDWTLPTRGIVHLIGARGAGIGVGDVGSSHERAFLLMG